MVLYALETDLHVMHEAELTQSNVVRCPKAAGQVFFPFLGTVFRHRKISIEGPTEDVPKTILNPQPPFKTDR